LAFLYRMRVIRERGADCILVTFYTHIDRSLRKQIFMFE